jgi:hypothetical protein
METKNKVEPSKTGLTTRGLVRYFRRNITKNATTNSPATAYNASKPGKPRNPAAADATADATADLTAPAVTFLVAFAVAFAVTFAVTFAVPILVCAKATVGPTIERITNVAKTAEKSFLLTIFHLQNRLSFIDA